MKGRPLSLRLLLGVRKPKLTRPGADVAGQVAAVGARVTQFRPGDAVFGSCRGSFAEFVCTAESKVARKPDGVTFEQAASAPVAILTALQGLRDKARVEPGQDVLINGAAGGVGTFAVQIARWLGARVTGVCSTRNLELVRSVGAERAIDYTREDFTRGEERYDVIFDCVGNHSLQSCRRVLKPKGKYIIVVGRSSRWMLGLLARPVEALVRSWFTSQKLQTVLARARQADLVTAGELMASGTVRPLIDRCYRLSEAAEAIRYVEQGHARGKVIVRPERT